MDSGQCSNPDNPLTRALVSYLDVATIRELLRARRTPSLRSLENELNEKLATLSRRINADAHTQEDNPDLVELNVRKGGNIDLLATTVGGETYFDQISESTKFLIAYHIFLEDRRGNSRDSVILFDEPNRGFHPSAEGKMLRFIESLTGRSNQVVLATHSQHMVDLEHLTGVRIMSSTEDKYLHINNNIYGTSGASQDTLALQPVTDAIGLQYADQLVAHEEVVIVEGYTDLIYLRVFAKILGYQQPNLAPVTGDGKLKTFSSFLISQGLSFKVMVDESERKTDLVSAFPISADSLFVVQEHLGDAASRTVGIEDLFTKDDFRELLSNAGHAINSAQLSAVSNSEYAKSHNLKRLVAEAANNTDILGADQLDTATKQNFEAALDFCHNDQWFTG